MCRGGRHSATDANPNRANRFPVRGNINSPRTFRIYIYLLFARCDSDSMKEFALTTLCWLLFLAQRLHLMIVVRETRARKTNKKRLPCQPLYLTHRNNSNNKNEYPNHTRTFFIALTSTLYFFVSGLLASFFCACLLVARWRISQCKTYTQKNKWQKRVSGGDSTLI